SRPAASALTSRSAPTSPGRSVRIASGTGPAGAGVRGRSRRAAIVSTWAVSAGTTDAHEIAATSPNEAPSRWRSSSSSTSSSSEVARGAVAALRVAIRAPFRSSPAVMFVLPISRASNMAGMIRGAIVALRRDAPSSGVTGVPAPGLLRYDRPVLPTRPQPSTAGDERVDVAARQVLREPGGRRLSHGHAPPAPAAAKADDLLPLHAWPRRRRAWHGLGGTDRHRRARDVDLLHAAGDHAEHRFVRASRVRDTAGPAAGLHVGPRRRARHRRVRADRRRRREHLAVR